MAKFLTQCPFCQTSFKVTEEQMQVASGVVRCGACREVFLADQNRITLKEKGEDEPQNEVSDDPIYADLSAQSELTANSTATEAQPELLSEPSTPFIDTSFPADAADTNAKPGIEENPELFERTDKSSEEEVIARLDRDFQINEEEHQATDDFSNTLDAEDLLDEGLPQIPSVDSAESETPLTSWENYEDLEDNEEHDDASDTAQHNKVEHGNVESIDSFELDESDEKGESEEQLESGSKRESKHPEKTQHQNAAFSNFLNPYGYSVQQISTDCDLPEDFSQSANESGMSDNGEVEEAEKIESIESIESIEGIESTESSAESPDTNAISEEPANQPVLAAPEDESKSDDDLAATPDGKPKIAEQINDVLPDSVNSHNDHQVFTEEEDHALNESGIQQHDENAASNERLHAVDGSNAEIEENEEQQALAMGYAESSEISESVEIPETNFPDNTLENPEIDTEEPESKETKTEDNIPTLAPDLVAQENIPLLTDNQPTNLFRSLRNTLPDSESVLSEETDTDPVMAEKAIIHSNLSALADEDSLAPLAAENLEAIDDEPVELDNLFDPLKTLKNTALILTSLLLLASLAGQYLWRNLDELSQDERFDLLTVPLCDFTQCPDRTVVDLSALITEELIIRSHPDLEDALQVDFIFRNEAPREQRFPLVELNFTNNTGTTIANRTFTPEEYLPPEMHLFTHMPAHSSIQVTLELVDPGEDSTGYSLVFRNP